MRVARRLRPGRRWWTVRAALLVGGALGAAACSSTPAYDGTGRDHPWVGREVQGPAACDVAGVLNADACVSGTPVRIAWEDGEPRMSDLACLGDRMNVAVRGGQVVGAWEDCAS